MKTNYLKSGVLVVLMALSGVALGNTEIVKSNDNISSGELNGFEVNVYPRENGLIAVNFKKDINETVEVKIYTLYGKRVFKQKISTHEMVANRYDMTRLPDGQYIVEVKNRDYIIRKVVNKVN